MRTTVCEVIQLAVCVRACVRACMRVCQTWHGHQRGVTISLTGNPSQKYTSLPKNWRLCKTEIKPECNHGVISFTQSHVCGGEPRLRMTEPLADAHFIPNHDTITCDQWTCFPVDCSKPVRTNNPA